MKIDIKEMTFQDILSIEEGFLENFDKFWDIKILKDDFQSESSKYIVAKTGSEVIGFAGIKRLLDEADIMNIVVRTNIRHLGVGSLLLEELIHLAQNLNCNLMTLEVNENNTPAIRLYEKYGFERIGFRKKYYNNTDNAIIMQKKLK